MPTVDPLSSVERARPLDLSMDNQRVSAEARHVYLTRNWRLWEKVRDEQLAKKPDCEFCEEFGRKRKATVVDHIEPRAIAPERTFDPTNLQSLCAPCHDRIKKKIEKQGYDHKIGIDGWPVDPRDPRST